jgi:hypothetical protein
MERIINTRFGKYFAVEKYDEEALQFYNEMYRVLPNGEKGELVVEFSTIALLEDEDDFIYLFECWCEEYGENNL